MATIPLRDYLSGIEELIDAGQIDDALAHCRQILKTYPKHVDTYRMMGKAYLEAHRHSEAGDIFQRVLSSSPDDFVAHIGMSIIREESADADGAIWNMERAFEAQPSNRAVQDELRRLYGKREGYAPPKVRLTRGALARMYAHGGLFNQAIGELRGALTEDPQRPDLQVLLAEMYFKTNRQTETIEVCSQLIEKLPYCLYANQVMAEILTSNQRAVEAKPFLDRLHELDPYAAQVNMATPAKNVPADSVLVEQLVLEGPAAPQQLPRAWTGALDAADLAAYGKEELPDWLSFEEEEKASAAEPVMEESSTTPEAEIGPSMLGDLEDLTPAPPAEEAPPLSQTGVVPPFSKVPTSALSEDQVPDWLRELGPATGTLSAEFLEDSEPSKQTDEFDTGELKAPELEPEQVVAAVPAEEASAPAAADEDDSLGWLERLAADQGAAEEELLTTPAEREQANPDWAPPPEPPKQKSGTLAWLDDMEADAEKGTQTQPMSDLQPEPEREPEAEPEPEPESIEDLRSELTTPSWLRDLSHEAEQSAAQADSAEPQALEDAPDWLDTLRPESETEAEAPLEPQASEEAPDWLDTLRPESETEAEAKLEPQKSEEASDWLDTFRPESETEAKAPMEEAVAEPAEEWQSSPDLSKLDWLDELGTPKAAPQESAWLPEADLEASPASEETPAAAPPGDVAPDAAALPSTAPTCTPTPVASPRRTARLAAEENAETWLEQARQALNFGKLDDAADQYGRLLRRRLLLDEVIADLDAAVHRNPADATMWQTLGDAYMRNNQLREALDCYTKAEDLL